MIFETPKTLNIYTLTLKKIQRPSELNFEIMDVIDVSQESFGDNDIIIVEEKHTNKRSASPIITSSSKRQKPNSTGEEVKNGPENLILIPDQSLEIDDDDLDEQIIEDSDVEIIEKPDVAISKDDWAKTQNGDDEVVCIICYGEVENATVTKCGHVYCFKCLHEYINKGYVECAVCRQKLALKLNRLLKMKYRLVPVD